MKISFKKLMPSKAILKIIAYNVVVVIIFFSFLEFFLFFLYNRKTDNLNLWLTNQNFYSSHDRKIIQFDPDCSQYDSSLTYTLKPGHCIFDNLEFYTKVEVNSLGLRDDESSLKEPKVIVLGDSYAMGWGVQQNESFPQVLEKESKLKVLNTGISSYGTPREIMLLKRLDVSNLKYLIIQYCSNDYGESTDYIKSSFQLIIITNKIYNDFVKYYLKKKNYYLGKFLLKYIPSYIEVLREKRKIYDERLAIKNGTSSLLKQMKIEIQKPSEAKAFLQIIENSKSIPQNVQIIVLSLEQNVEMDGSFEIALKNEILKPGYSKLVKNMKIIDMSNILKDEDFFYLDDHINSNGHQKVAQEILKSIR
jgi:lysophospholipase L1-like esterase